MFSDVDNLVQPSIPKGFIPGCGKNQSRLLLQYRFHPLKSTSHKYLKAPLTNTSFRRRLPTSFKCATIPCVEHCLKEVVRRVANYIKFSHSTNLLSLIERLVCKVDLLKSKVWGPSGPWPFLFCALWNWLSFPGPYFPLTFHPSIWETTRIGDTQNSLFWEWEIEVYKQ